MTLQWLTVLWLYRGEGHYRSPVSQCKDIILIIANPIRSSSPAIKDCSHKVMHTQQFLIEQREIIWPGRPIHASYIFSRCV